MLTESSVEELESSSLRAVAFATAECLKGAAEGGGAEHMLDVVTLVRVTMGTAAAVSVLSIPVIAFAV